MASLASLSFTDRFDAIDAIASLLKLLDPSLPHSDAIKAAQQAEQTCYDSATSQKEYVELWNLHLQALRNTFPSPPSPTPLSDTPSYLPSPPEPSTPATSLGPYPSCFHHASGLFSAVYKSAPSSSTPSPTPYVALKLTSPSSMELPHDSRREARILRAAAHVNVLPLLETFTIPTSQFILVTPFYPLTFADLLCRNMPLAHSVTTSVLRDVLSAICHIHSLDILHRDIKPSNILLSSPSGPAVLADFGIAWSASDNDEKYDDKVTDVGTTCYRAPEVLFGLRSYGKGVDMWGFGCVVAETVSRNPGGDKETTFFEAGDLGSELALIGSIFRKLGTANLEVWPEAKNLPDFGKIGFHEFPRKSWDELLPNATDLARDLVAKLLVYESGRRLSAAEALGHSFFKE